MMLTDFQRSCDEAVHELLQQVGVSFEREYLEGRTEEMVRYTVGDLKAWIYEDGAEIQGPDIDHRFERYDFKSLSELQTEFIGNLRELVTG